MAKKATKTKSKAPVKEQKQKKGKAKETKEENPYLEKSPNELLMVNAILSDKLAKIAKDKSNDEEITQLKEDLKKEQEFEVTPEMEKLQLQIAEIQQKIEAEKMLDVEKIKKIKDEIKEIEDEYKESEKTIKKSLKEIEEALYQLGKEEEKKHKAKNLDE